MSEDVSEVTIQNSAYIRRGHQRKNQDATRLRTATPKPDIIEPKRCRTCRCTKEKTEFSSYLCGGKRYWHNRCIKCRASRYLRSKVCGEKQELIAKLKDGPCVKCGIDWPHYLKRLVCVQGKPAFNFEAAWTGRSRKSIIAEAKRSEINCVNCLAEAEYKERQTVHPKLSKLAELAPEHFKRAELSSDLHNARDIKARV